MIREFDVVVVGAGPIGGYLSRGSMNTETAYSDRGT